MNKTQYLAITAIAAATFSCSSSSDSCKLRKRIGTLEAQLEKNTMALAQLTEHVFDGKSETIEGRTYFPKAKVFENKFFKVFYRTKKDDYFYDAVVISKGENPNFAFTTMTASAFKIEGSMIEMKEVEATIEKN